MARLTQPQIESISRAVSDPSRFAILKQIAADQCVGCSALHAQKSLSPATISHHLKELEQAGLITAERAGKFVNLTFQREIWDNYLKTLSTL